jgi:hypothetical protein
MRGASQLAAKMPAAIDNANRTGQTIASGIEKLRK